MDPISAIGLASSILAIVDRASYIIATSKLVYSRGSKESPTYLRELEVAVQRIQSSRIDLENALRLCSKTAEDDERMKYIRQAVEATDELETWMKNIISSDRKHRPASAFGRFKRDQKQQLETQKMETKLADLEAAVRISLSLQARTISTQTALISHNIATESQSVVTALANELQEDSKRAKPREEIIAIGQLLEEYGEQGGQPPPATQEDVKEQANRAVLQQLQYEVMAQRAETIKSATASSCEWVWHEKPKSGQLALSEWLVSATADGVYFIAGHEGSGKSTLMKYLFYERKTNELLGQWAAHATMPLATAAFFFWRNGTELEKSEEGLLRSILYSVLSQQPRIIPSVLPGIYAKAVSSIAAPNSTGSDIGIERWELDVLRKAFIRLIQQEQLPIKLFFMIDGIDEFQDNQEDKRMLFELFTKIRASKHAKAIISSRKLDDMETARIEPSLTLHDSNDSSIRTYIKETIEKELGAYADRLPDDAGDRIAVSANGSFLWASLTLKNMSNLLANGQSFDNADELLNGAMLPSTIHELYDHMWDAIPSQHKRRASEIVQIVLVGTSGFSQSDDEEIRLVDLMLALGDPEDTIRSKIVEWNEGTIKQKCEETAHPFMSVWPGFLTVGRDKESGPSVLPYTRIQYCHRSVPEYFLSRHDQENQTHTHDSRRFCPHLAHVKSAVQHLKILPMGVVEDAKSMHLLWVFVTRALLSSKKVWSASAAHPLDKVHCQCLQLLQQLDLTMSHHRGRQRQPKKGDISGETTLRDPQGYYKVRDFGREKRYLDSLSWVNFHPDHPHTRGDEDTFLSLCIRFGLKDYLQDPTVLNKKILKSKKGRPLLDYALFPSRIAPYDLITSELVQALLKHGADPNKKVQARSWDNKTWKTTCWEHAIAWQHEAYKIHGAKEIGGTTAHARKIAELRLEIVKVLIQSGAKVGTDILLSTGVRLAPKAALEQSFGGWVEAENLTAVLELLDARPARWGIGRVFKRQQRHARGSDSPRQGQD